MERRDHRRGRKRVARKHVSAADGLPDEIWEIIILKLAEDDDDNRDSHLEPLTLVSRRFLSITNRLKQTLKISWELISFSFVCIEKVFRRFPNLCRYSLERFIFPRYLIDEVGNSPVKTFRLSPDLKFPQDVDGMVNWPVRTCLGVRSLVVASSKGLSDDDLGVLGDVFRNVEELDVSVSNTGVYRAPADGSAKQMTDQGIAILASKVRRLKRINLQGNVLLSDKSVISLCKNCADLEEIGLEGCPSVTQKGVEFALSDCKNLKVIRLSRLELVGSVIVHPLSQARSLGELHFSDMNVSDDLLRAIVKANLVLKKFAMSSCRWHFRSTGILSLMRAYQSHLDYLSLEGANNLTDKSMITLSTYLPNAKTVKLNSCKNLSDLTFYALIKNCPLLDTLEMRGTSMGKEVSVFNNKPPCNSEIRNLDLSLCVNLSDSSLMGIALSCTRLEVANLSRCQAITGEGIVPMVRHCPGLRRMYIQRCKRVKNFELGDEISDGKFKLEVFDASNSDLDDKALLSIAGHCPNLKYLDVNYCPGVTRQGSKEAHNKCGKLKRRCWFPPREDMVPFRLQPHM